MRLYQRVFLRTAAMVAGGLGLVAVVAAVLVPAVLVATVCDNHVLRSVPSPDGWYRAVVFERDCGATTGFSPQVSVLPAWEPLWGYGNVLILGDAAGLAPREARRRPPLRVRWAGPRELAVAYDTAAPHGVPRSRRWGVRVRYEHAPAAPVAR
jgi:hypothetical protein